MPRFGETEDVHSAVAEALDNVVGLIMQRSYIQAGERRHIQWYL